MALDTFVVFVTLFLITYSIEQREEAQGPPTCGCDEHGIQYQIEKDPSSVVRRDAFEQALMAQHLANMAVNDKTVQIEAPWKGILEIPINIHMVWLERFPTENLNYEQIMSQIIAMNEDLNKQNSDWSDVPDEFIGLVADYKIAFKLSKIIRVKTATSAFTYIDDTIKFTQTGGSDIIDGDFVLNIWVGNLAGSLIGYGRFPWFCCPETDGVVAENSYFGSIKYDYDNSFYLANQYNRGRVMTHEIGHWIALLHVWGSDSGCDDTDFVDDTPPQAFLNYGCPVHPQVTCGSNDMFMNYMDYTECVNMFSNGQKERSYMAFEYFDNRASFIEYQNDKATKFIASIYFIVNYKLSDNILSCGYQDEPNFGIIDLNDGFDSNYEIIPCIQYTNNGNVDPIIDIEVVDDGDCTDPFTNYFVNTNLNYDRWFANMIKTNICYTKGEKRQSIKIKS